MAKFTFWVLALLLVVIGNGVRSQENPVETSDDPETTEEPDTTTPAAPTTTTSTAAPTTTPEPTTTPVPTTTPPDTTTPPATTTPEPVTTVAPDTDFVYNVTEKNVTCMMIDGEITFTVNYTTKNGSAVATVTVPKHGANGARAEGKCNTTDGDQTIKIIWGAASEGSSSVTFVFNRTKDNWSIKSFTAALFFDSKTFANATNSGKTLEVDPVYGWNPLEIAVNHSFNCHSHIAAGVVNGTMDKDAYTLPLTATLDSIQIQAFNEIPGEPDFVDSVHCAADQTSDIVPIAVGCALAALVVVVLVAYLVGRRRRSAAYQSV